MSIQSQTNKQRLDTLEKDAQFILKGRLYICGDTVKASDFSSPCFYCKGYVRCWDRNKGESDVFGLGTMVEVVDTQGVFDIAFGRIDTTIQNLHFDVDVIEKDEKDTLVLHTETARSMRNQLNRLKSHLTDLRECLRKTTPQFDTEGIE